ncbi:MAG: hypothetical protein HC880_16040 [Bacteroidia bacterium]|nr:hypothetical protein [Bacteroidia bacterium]
MKSIIITPTNNLEFSLDFYHQLGFTNLSDDPLWVSDGKAVIEINPDRFTRAGIKLFKESWAEEVEKVAGLTAVTTRENGCLFSDPSGVWIYLEESSPKINIHSTPESYSVLGNFVGLSLETTDIARSVRFYEILGFTQAGGAPEQGYVTYALENFMITFMKPLACPHLFFNPSLTYFNGKNNLAVIENIRSLNITITEEITYFNKQGIVDNVIIRDPGGYGFFIFSD